MPVDAKSVRRMATKIERIKKYASELRSEAEEFEAVKRNADRILASVRMLEISVVDVADMLRE